VSKTQQLDPRVVLIPSISMIIPWLCVREVPVDIELVSQNSSLFMVRYLKTKHRHRPKLLLSVSSVGCSRDSSDVSVVRRLWNIMHLEL
jgi:hypothetical protein